MTTTMYNMYTINIKSMTAILAAFNVNDIYMI